MKKPFLLALLGASAQLAQAQSIPAGTISLGGSIGYNRRTETTQLVVVPVGTGSIGGVTVTASSHVASQFRLAPTVGYFVAENLALGLSLDYSATQNTYTSAAANSTSSPDPNISLRVGPYVQYYKLLTEQFGLVGTLAGGYQRTTEQISTGTSAATANNFFELKARGYYAALTPGIIFFPVPRLGISASVGGLGYDRVKSTSVANEPVTSSFGASFGLSQLLFGGTYYFGR